MPLLEPAALWEIRFYLQPRMEGEVDAEPQLLGHEIAIILAPRWPLASASVHHKTRNADRVRDGLTGLPATYTRPSIGALCGLRLGHCGAVEEDSSSYRVPGPLVPAALGPVDHILDLHCS